MNNKAKEYDVESEKESDGLLYLALKLKTETSKEDIKAPEQVKYKFSQRSLNNLKNVHPDLAKVMMEAIKNSPADFTVTDSTRTAEQQHILYCNSRQSLAECQRHPKNVFDGTKWKSNADGYRTKSNHQAKTDNYGYAVDLYAFYDGSVQTEDDDTLIKKIAPHIKKIAKSLGINIEWGGDWKKTKDNPHFELIK